MKLWNFTDAFWGRMRNRNFLEGREHRKKKKTVVHGLTEGREGGPSKNWKITALGLEDMNYFVRWKPVTWIMRRSVSTTAFGEQTELDHPARAESHIQCIRNNPGSIFLIASWCKWPKCRLLPSRGYEFYDVALWIRLARAFERHKWFDEVFQCFVRILSQSVTGFGNSRGD